MLMVVVWAAAVILRRLGWPTVMGELVMGVILGPAVLGWVEPSEVIEVLAGMGIFFLMLHTGVETRPKEFFQTLRARPKPIVCVSDPEELPEEEKKSAVGSSVAGSKG